MTRTFLMYRSIKALFSWFVAVIFASLFFRIVIGFENSRLSPFDFTPSFFFSLFLVVSVSSFSLSLAWMFLISSSNLFFSYSCFAFNERIWLFVSSAYFLDSCFSTLYFLASLMHFEISVSIRSHSVVWEWSSFHIVFISFLSNLFFAFVSFNHSSSFAYSFEMFNKRTWFYFYSSRDGLTIFIFSSFSLISKLICFIWSSIMISLLLSCSSNFVKISVSFYSLIVSDS